MVPSTLKVAGALSGAVYIDAPDPTVESLRVEVARLLGECEQAEYEHSNRLS